MSLLLVFIFAFGCQSQPTNPDPGSNAATLADLLVEPQVIDQTPKQMPLDVVQGDITVEPKEESEKCLKARSDLANKKTELVEKRAKLVQEPEKAMTAAQSAFYVCLTTPECLADEEHAKDLRAFQDKEEKRYQAAVAEASKLDAQLYSYLQAVEQNCGR